MELEFFPVTIAKKWHKNRVILEIYGVMENGQRICVIDYDAFSYFYVDAKSDLTFLEDTDKHQVLDIITENEKQKVCVNTFQAVKYFSKLCKEKGYTTYDDFIPFLDQYLKDKTIHFFTLYSVEVVEHQTNFVVPTYKLIGSFTSLDSKFLNPKVAAISIKTKKFDTLVDDTTPLSMISVHTVASTRTFTLTRIIKEGTTVCSSELDLIQSFSRYIEALRPDIICGHDTDTLLSYVSARADKYKIPLYWGLDHSKLYATSNAVIINGICHIDLKEIAGLFHVKREFASMYKKILKRPFEDGPNPLAFYQLLALQHKKLEVYVSHNEKIAQGYLEIFAKLFPYYIELLSLTHQPFEELSRAKRIKIASSYLFSRQNTQLHIDLNAESTYALFSDNSSTQGIHTKIAMLSLKEAFLEYLAHHSVLYEHASQTILDLIDRRQSLLEYNINDSLDTRNKVFKALLEGLYDVVQSHKYHAVCVSNDIAYTHHKSEFEHIVMTVLTKHATFIHVKDGSVFISYKELDHLQQLRSELVKALHCSDIGFRIFESAIVFSDSHLVLKKKNRIIGAKTNFASVLQATIYKKLLVMLFENEQKEIGPYVLGLKEFIESQDVPLNKLKGTITLTKELLDESNDEPVLQLLSFLRAQGDKPVVGQEIEYVVSQTQKNGHPLYLPPEYINSYDIDYYCKQLYDAALPFIDLLGLKEAFNQAFFNEYE